MFRRVFLFSVFLVAACASGDGRAGETSGRLLLARTSPRRETLLDRPAAARYCGRDSTLSIVAVDDDWAGALAVRSAWPIARETRFAVASTLGTAGSGAVAARPLLDTAATVVIGGSGSITVTPGPLLSGRFDVEMPADSGPSTHLTGNFERLVVRTGACS